MYRVFIADDEKRVREGLREAVNWDLCGMEVAGLFANGRAALEAAELETPDLIVSDIRMPVMDGLTLCRTVRCAHPAVKFVFVSGYDDVEYLKAAIRESAVDYVMKPVRITELENVLLRVRQLLDQEAQGARHTAVVNARLRESLPLLRERFFWALLEGKMDNEAIKRECAFVELEADRYAVYQVAALSADVEHNRPEGGKQTGRAGLTMEDLCARSMHGKGYALARAPDSCVLLFCMNGERDGGIIPFLETLKQEILEKTGVSVTVGVSLPFVRLEESRIGYQSALNAVREKLYLGKNRVICFEASDDSCAAFDRSPELPAGFREALRTGDAAEVSARLNAWYDKLCAAPRRDVAYLRNFCIELVLVCAQISMDFDPKSGAFTPAEYSGRISRLDTLEEMVAAVQEYAVQICAVIAQKKTGRYNRAVSAVLDMIGTCYSEHLTIEQLARRVYLAPQYLCIVFKQQTGSTINDHITDVRIEQAKRLLRESSLHLYDVCAAVGYADASYFSKTFKKMTGLTPSEYRERQGCT